MLVLSQLSAGAFTLEQALAGFPASDDAPWLRPVLALTALLIGFLALAISSLHLGRPLGAWRAFLGLRRSWLSREIVLFGLFAGMAALHTGALWFPSFTPVPLQIALGCATVVSGWLGVFSSAMLYHDTRREFWRLRWSGGKFLGTAALLGAATALPIALCAGGSPRLITTLAVIVVFSTAAKLAVEWPIFRHLEAGDFSPLHKTALLLEGRLGLAHRCRVACGMMGGILMPACLALQTVAPVDARARIGSLAAQAAAILLLSLAGELIERRLFFTAVQPVKMPGGVAA